MGIFSRSGSGNHHLSRRSPAPRLQNPAFASHHPIPSALTTEMLNALRRRENVRRATKFPAAVPNYQLAACRRSGRDTKVGKMQKTTGLPSFAAAYLRVGDQWVGVLRAETLTAYVCDTTGSGGKRSERWDHGKGPRDAYRAVMHLNGW